MPTEFVRVKDPDTKHEVTVTRAFAEGYKLDIIEKDAVDANGRPLPGKPYVELAKAEPKTDDTGAAGDATPPATATAQTRNGGSAR
jgi:hypothetical protein